MQVRKKITLTGALCALVSGASVVALAPGSPAFAAFVAALAGLMMVVVGVSMKDPPTTAKEIAAINRG